MNTNLLCCGIDVSHLTLDVTYQNNRGELFYLQLGNNTAGFKKILEHTGTHYHFVMEATGVYYIRLAFYLHAQGCRLSVVNAISIKRFIQMHLERNKSDKKDSGWICKYAIEQRPTFWEMSDSAYFESRQLYNTIREYTEQIKRFNNQLHSLRLLPVVSKDTIKSIEKIKLQLEKEVSVLEKKLDALLKSWQPGQHKSISSIKGIGKRATAMLIIFTQGFKNTQSNQYFNHRSYIWNQYLEHDTYDSYWQSRNIRPYLKDIRIPTLVVGGWFDAEDLFGSLHTFQAIDRQGGRNDFLVMGPWTHGAWASASWTGFGSYSFGSNTAQYFQDSIQTRFFNFYLKDEGSFGNRKATVFETGKDQWEQFATWPPANAHPVRYYLTSSKGLSAAKEKKAKAFLSYISDPSDPVPYTKKVMGRRNNEYMVEDQSFASSRNDVLTFTSPELKNDLTVAGPLEADLYVSLNTTDADFIVKIIDEVPLPSDDVSDKNAGNAGFYQRLVRAEVFRGKFRNNYSKPEPFIPGKIEKVHINLNDVFHEFKKGHHIMVQVQSSWFPLVDMNPQKFLRIPDANAGDFQKAEIKVYMDAAHPSSVTLPVLNE